MTRVQIPSDLNGVLDSAWLAAKNVPGFLLESEARFIGMAAACAPPVGSIVEIGSFKGRSTVMLAKVCQRYGLDPVIAIDPHNFNSVELQSYRSVPDASSYEEFSQNIQSTGVSDVVTPLRALSTDVSRNWTSPIRFLWIDGDHTYEGTKGDFDGFIDHVVTGGFVAFHDALHEFSGPIRVFVEDVLTSDLFGAAGFVGSIAWAQLRRGDGALFRSQRTKLKQMALPLVRLHQSEERLRGFRKLLFKLRRSRVPRTLIQPSDWASLLNNFDRS